MAFSPPQIDDMSDTDRSNIFFTNWGCGHNFGLKYIGRTIDYVQIKRN